MLGPSPASLRFPTLFLLLPFLLFARSTRAADTPPPTPRIPVTDTYPGGVQVRDDYRWLENPADPAVKAWVASQNKATRAYLDSLPDHTPLQQRLTRLYAQVSPSYSALVSRPAGLFASKFQPPLQQSLLVLLKSPDQLATERVLLDPNQLEPRGKTTIDWFVPSPSGQYVAVSLSTGGSEQGTLYIYRTATGERLPESIPRVQNPTGGGSAAWDGDDALLYTRYPAPGQGPLGFAMQVFHHRLGTPVAGDVYSLGREFPRIAEIGLSSSRFAPHAILASVANGDGGDVAFWLLPDARAAHPAWHQLTRFEDQIKDIQFGPAGQLYLRSVKDAPHGRILRLSLPSEPASTASPGASPAESAPAPAQPLPGLTHAQVIVPESRDAVIGGMVLTSFNLYVGDLVGGPTRLRQFDLDGGHELTVPLPPISSLQQVVPLEGGTAPFQDSRVLLREISYTTPYTWYLFEPPSTAPGAPAVLTKTSISGTSPVDFSDIEVVREFATSVDGTRVPLNILRRKGTVLDGSHPTLLTGYGGYGISLTPNFVFHRRLWFDRGGLIAVANLRGGGEYGEEWHTAGNLTKKQNVFDDFAACAKFLVQRGYTRPGKLAVQGGSNGGLLMGAFLTQHPAMARAVVSSVGIYDMLRVELEPNGAYNVTEFGTVRDPAQFQALYAYSPYHHVVDGEKYPATLFYTGDNDGRVNPANSRKMVARLQAANASGYPILLRTSADAGHGIGTALAEKIAEEADVYAFLFDQLGMKETAPAR